MRELWRIGANWYWHSDQELLRREVAWTWRWFHRPWVAAFLLANPFIYTYGGLFASWGSQIIISKSMAGGSGISFYYILPFLIFIQFANPGNILFLWIWLRVFQKRLDNFFGLDHNQSILLTHLTPRDLWPAVMVSSLLFMIMTEIFHMSFGIVNDMANLIGFNLTPGIGPHEMAQIRALENLSQNHMRPSDLLEVVWSYLALILLPRVISVGSSIAVYMAVEAYVAARVLNDCSMANVVYRFVIGWARIVIPLSFAVQFGVGLLASIWGSMHISSLVISLCAGIPYCLVGFHQWNRNLRKLRSGSPMEALRGN